MKAKQLQLCFGDGTKLEDRVTGLSCSKQMQYLGDTYHRYLCRLPSLCFQTRKLNYLATHRCSLTSAIERTHRHTMGFVTRQSRRYRHLCWQHSLILQLRLMVPI